MRIHPKGTIYLNNNIILTHIYTFLHVLSPIIYFEAKKATPNNTSRILVNPSLFYAYMYKIKAIYDAKNGLYTQFNCILISLNLFELVTSFVEMCSINKTFTNYRIRNWNFLNCLFLSALEEEKRISIILIIDTIWPKKWLLFY